MDRERPCFTGLSSSLLFVYLFGPILLLSLLLCPHYGVCLSSTCLPVRYPTYFSGKTLKKCTFSHLNGSILSAGLQWDSGGLAPSRFKKTSLSQSHKIDCPKLGLQRFLRILILILRPVLWYKGNGRKGVGKQGSKRW